MSKNEDKIAIVTGANRGIGFSIVKRLCSAYDGTVYLTSRSFENGIKAIEILERLNLHAKFHQLDIENSDSIQLFVNYLRENYNGVDIIINCAGSSYYNQNNRNDCISKFISTFNFCNAVFPLLRSNGRVVNLSCRQGFLNKIVDKKLRAKIADVNLQIDELLTIVQNYSEVCESDYAVKKLGYPKTSYDMSKIAINALSRLQQKNFDSDPTRSNIIVSSVCPGLLKSKINKGKGLIDPDLGAETPVWLALVDDDLLEARGALWAEKTEIDWIHSRTNLRPFFRMLFKAIRFSFKKRK